MTHQEQLDQLRSFLENRMVQAQRIQQSLDLIETKLVGLGEVVAPQEKVTSGDLITTVSLHLRLQALEKEVFALPWWRRVMQWITHLTKGGPNAS